MQSHLDPDNYHAVLRLDGKASKRGGWRSCNVPSSQIIPSAMTGANKLMFFLFIIDETSQVCAGCRKNAEPIGGRYDKDPRLPLLAGDHIGELALLNA